MCIRDRVFCFCLASAEGRKGGSTNTHAHTHTCVRTHCECETGDLRQETGNRRLETEDRRRVPDRDSDICEDVRGDGSLGGKWFTKNKPTSKLLLMER